MPTTVHINRVRGKGYFEEIREAMKKGKHPRLEVTNLRDNKGNIEYRGKRLVEPKEEVFVLLIIKHHDSATMGHPGREQTLRNIMRRYYWENMRKDVDRYVVNC